MQATLFVLTTFSVVQEMKRRRIKAIEAAVPDLLTAWPASMRRG
ncbi:hypothetical protein ACFFQF_01780 [Haladaptatus pallidirubidus]